LFRLLILVLLLISCTSLNNNFDDRNLEKLGLIEIKSNQTYISRLIEYNIKNTLDVYNTKNSKEKRYTVILEVNDSIERSLLASSVRKIEMYVNYKVIDKSNNTVLLNDSFSRNSLVGPIDSLFSRNQSEINAQKRLGISISNDLIVRLIEWASFDIES
tara:strand:- start:178 stop:654 length:477 start_codon:yes stop_codon:yes gene_type:complete